MTLPLLSLVFGGSDELDGGRTSGSRSRSARNVVFSEAQADLRAVDPDASILERLRMGDSTAVDVLVGRYYAQLVAFATNIIGDVPGAEDIVQDALVATWERRAALVVRTTVAAYLFTAVRNTALNARRSARNRARWTDAHVRDTLSETPANIDTALENEEEELILQAALVALSPRYREVVTLRASGLTYPVIAEVLELPLKTVKTRGLRGIAMLRVALERRR